MSLREERRKKNKILPSFFLRSTLMRISCFVSLASSNRNLQILSLFIIYVSCVIEKWLIYFELFWSERREASFLIRYSSWIWQKHKNWTIITRKAFFDGIRHNILNKSPHFYPTHPPLPNKTDEQNDCLEYNEVWLVRMLLQLFLSFSFLFSAFLPFLLSGDACTGTRIRTRIRSYRTNVTMQTYYV